MYTPSAFWGCCRGIGEKELKEHIQSSKSSRLQTVTVETVATESA